MRTKTELYVVIEWEPQEQEEVGQDDPIRTTTDLACYISSVLKQHAFIDNQKYWQIKSVTPGSSTTYSGGG